MYTIIDMNLIICNRKYLYIFIKYKKYYNFDIKTLK